MSSHPRLLICFFFHSEKKNIFKEWNPDSIYNVSLLYSHWWQLLTAQDYNLIVSSTKKSCCQDNKQDNNQDNDHDKEIMEQYYQASISWWLDRVKTLKLSCLWLKETNFTLSARLTGTGFSTRVGLTWS